MSERILPPMLVRFARRSFVLAATGCFAIFSSASCNGDDPVEEEEPEVDTEWKEGFDATNFGWLLSVWGRSADDLYAVGGSPDKGAAMHFDGETWSAVDVPDSELLNWVHGFDGGELFIAANGGKVLVGDADGFVVTDTPTEEDLWGVWGASPDDVWAVGGRGIAEAEAVILRYDGSSWEQVPLPPLEKANVRALFKVWGTSADNVYAVGQHGVVIHYDGSAWSEILVGASDDLISLWGTGPDRIVAVGGRGNGIVTRFDGSTWTTESISPLPGLNGVWMRDPDTIHAVGITGTVLKLDFDTLGLEEFPQDTFLDLHAVFGASSGDGPATLTAVGGSLASIQPPHNGICITRGIEETE